MLVDSRSIDIDSFRGGAHFSTGQLYPQVTRIQYLTNIAGVLARLLRIHRTDAI